MRFCSAISDDQSTDAAVEQVINDARRELGDKIDVVFAFFTAHHREESARLLERLWLQLDPQAIVGCSAEGVIGGDREIERLPGLAILAGELPSVRIHPFHIAMADWKALLSDPNELIERIHYGQETRAIIGFGDPFTSPMNQLLPTLDKACPKAPLIGGMASSARTERENVLLHNDQMYDQGFVGLSLSGPIQVDTVVSQGCRAIGKPMIITKGQQNVILELGGKPALAALRETVAELSEADQELLSNGLLVGRAISEYRDRFGRGDFLNRNIVGANEEAGAVAVGEHVRVGQTIQFFVRDAGTAHDDLTMMLGGQEIANPPSGGLLFSCNGRGARLFETSGHDIDAAHKAMPSVPFAGFFAAGELGPVGGQNFIHGHTASFALFRPI
jgi:small ligand-binding sensory domain FIST